MANVAAILAEKGGEVISVRSDMPVGEVVGVLHGRGIGAVLVVDEGRLRGVLSERGIVRGMALHPNGVRSLRAESLMKPVRVMAQRGTTLTEAMRMMTDHGVRYLPVVEEGRLLGLVSIGDIVRAELGRRSHEVEHLTAYISGGG